ncbi:biogenesis of lysosome-related organelles complex 1 subunit 5 [Protopterus annectens]|uniref:biogenesis of lysosome-related organelles complex 1 subunit 5 n=1 Tax=Protopterus annectens TaxID=7888 RepID=UPI001CFAAB31|nr:biogenesis of lysosome-related organelles complex 1 subunit 5 [Protopterus annectens]
MEKIVKDVGEIQSRLLDHRPVLQGELRYFVKEFEEKRGLREMRVLNNLQNMTVETNELILPKCLKIMQENLYEAWTTLVATNHMIQRIHQRGQKTQQLQNERLETSHETYKAEWDAFMKEQSLKQAAIDEEHNKAVQKLKEQYAEMERDLAKNAFL